MLIDDQPDYPMTFCVRSCFRNLPDPAALAEALEESLLRHPLLGCRVEWKSSVPSWIPDPERSPKVKVIGPEDRLWPAGGERIDLSHECGLRVWIRNIDDHSEVILQFHHACCDGMGALQFLTDLSVAYALRTDPETVRDTGTGTGIRLDPELLRTRHHSLNRRSVRRSKGLLFALRGFAKEFIKHQRQKPVPLAVVDRSFSGTDAGVPVIQRYQLDRVTTHALKERARTCGATLNDIVLRDVLLTLQQWNAKHQPEAKKGDLRVLMPMSLRAKGDEHLPAANLIGYAFITRHTRELSDTQQLLKSISHDTVAIKTYRLGWMWLDTLARLQRMRLMNLVSKLVVGRCQATAVHSHLGNRVSLYESRFKRDGPYRKIGNLLLMDVQWVPPIRHLTHVAVATSTQNGLLTVNVRCDRHKYSVEHAEDFLQSLIQHLRQSAQ